MKVNVHAVCMSEGLSIGLLLPWRTILRTRVCCTVDMDMDMDIVISNSELCTNELLRMGCVHVCEVRKRVYIYGLVPSQVIHEPHDE